jgi:hypothetical protein
MDLPHTTTVWIVRQGIRLAWAMASLAERLGDAGVRLEVRLDATAAARGVDMLDVLEPLTRDLSVSSGRA